MQHQQQSATQSKTEAPIAGKPVKRRVLGESGWIQVTTDKGLKYYINASTKETTWIAPEAALIWIERRKAEKLQEKQLLKKQTETEKKLTAEEQLQQWVEITKSLIESKQIPPIMTYDRAQARLCLEKPFLECPPDRRQEVYELAKKAIISKGGASHLLEEFRTRLNTLKDKGIIRQDHTAELIWDTYFREDKWLGLRKNDAANQAIEKTIQAVQEEVSIKLEKMMPTFQDFVSRCFRAFVSKTGEAIGKSVKEMLEDNNFVIEFTTNTSLDEFKSFVQTEDASNDQQTREKDLLVWGEFSMSLDPELINELLIDTWQSWCQSQWQKPESADSGAVDNIKEEETDKDSADEAEEAPIDPKGEVAKPSTGDTSFGVSQRKVEKDSRNIDPEDGAISESTEDVSRRKATVPRPAKVESRVSCMADRLKKRPLGDDGSGKETSQEKRRKLVTAEASLAKRKEILIAMFDTIKDPYQYLDSRTFHSVTPPGRKQLMSIQEGLLSRILKALERSDRTRWDQLEIDLIATTNNRYKIKPRHGDQNIDLPRQLILDYFKVKLCFEQWLQTWLSQRKHQLGVLMSECSNVDLSNLFRAISRDARFDSIVKKVPRFILTPWLDDLREEILEDLLTGFENFLKSNPQVSQYLSKQDLERQDVRDLVFNVKNLIRDESIYQRLSFDRARRDDTIASFLKSYKKARESSHNEAMRLLDKKSAASKAAQDDYEKNKIRLEDSVAEREEELFLLGAGDEEL